MVEYDINIEDRILSYLDGWSTKNPKRRDESDLLLEENKLIPTDEVEDFFDKACVKIATYLFVEEIPSDERIIEEICQYTAGLLFKKYNLTPNDNYEDGTTNLGYGNYLINSALKNLIPFRNNIVSMWTVR